MSRIGDVNKVTVAEVEAFIAVAQSCINKLQSATKVLPKVDKDGSSECPFAEELYAQKEEAQKEAQECLEKLGEYQLWVENQIRICQNNLSIISSGKAALRTDRPRDRLSEAEDNLSAFCKKLEELLGKIEDVFRQLQAAIMEASQKQFPGRIPRKNPGFPILLSEPDSAHNRNISAGLDNDLKLMISRGPSGRNGS